MLSIRWAGHIVLQVLFVSAIVERFARLGMERLSLPAANLTIEFNIGRVKFWLTGLQGDVETLDKARDFIAIKIAVVVVQIIEIRGMIVLGLIVASLNAPHIGPMRGGRMIGAEKIVGTGNPLVE